MLLWSQEKKLNIEVAPNILPFIFFFIVVIDFLDYVLSFVLFKNFKNYYIFYYNLFYY
jgi:hypothetical protein